MYKLQFFAIKALCSVQEMRSARDSKIYFKKYFMCPFFSKNHYGAVFCSCSSAVSVNGLITSVTRDQLKGSQGDGAVLFETSVQ